MRQVDPLQLVADAQAGGYAVGAFNMHSDETAQALVRAAEIAKAPVFLQIGRAIVPHMGLRAAYELTRRAADESDADVVIHLDHGPWEEVFEAIKLGFGSIMYDGAHLPLEENIRTTRHVVQVAHSFGIPVEAELGTIPDAGEQVDWSGYYTKVDEAERFVAETGVDWLAVSAGIVHGVVPDLPPQPLDLDRIETIRRVTGLPLVLHGMSGVSAGDVQGAVKAGVHKFNADTDLRHAFRAGLESVFAEGDRQLEQALAVGRDRMVEATVAKMREYGVAGRATGVHA